MKPTLLIVDDERGIVDTMKAYFSPQYEVLTACNGQEAVQKAERQPDLILLDINMPGMDGLSVCRTIRAHVACPILFLTARIESADQIIGFQAGADDYILKPFDLDELAARVAVQLRHRAQGHQGVAGARGASSVPGAASTVSGAGAPLRCGRWMVDQAARTLSVDGGAVPLTRTEYAIAELLASHPGRVFTKQELFEHAWGEPYAAQESTVSAHVSNLRAKLKPTGTDGYVATVWGIGFKLDIG